MSIGPWRLGKSVATALFSAIVLVACSSGGPPTPADSVNNPFGVFPSLKLFDAQQQADQARRLGGAYIRSFPVLLGVSTQCADCGFFERGGLRVVLTIKNTFQINVASTPPADMAVYERDVGKAIDSAHPTLVAIENEEDTAKMFTGTAAQYGEMLAAACRAAHSRHVPCTNGGLLSGSVVLLLYQHLVDAGMQGDADRVAQNDLLPYQRRLASDPAALGARVAELRGLLDLDRSAGVDYLNIHWYQADAAALREAVEYIRAEWGLPVVTNEIGQRDLLPSTTTALMQAVVDAGISIAVWYVHDARLARGLVDDRGSLRSTGQAFAAFVRSHFPSASLSPG